MDSPIAQKVVAQQKCAVITVFEGPLVGQQCALLPGEQVLAGRSHECDFSIADARISRQHFVLEYHHETWWVRDLSSSNGTFLNEQKVCHQQQIVSGDIVTAGDTRFIVRTGLPNQGAIAGGTTVAETASESSPQTETNSCRQTVRFDEPK